MNVTLPDGTTVRDVPDGTTKAQLAEKLRANGRQVPDSWMTPQIPDSTPQPKPPKEPGALHDSIAGSLEAGASMATAIPAGIAGNLAGLWRSLTGGKFGTPEGTREGAQRAQEVSQGLTYEPRSGEGKRTMQRVGDLVQESGIAGINPATPISALPPAAMGAKVRDVAGGGARRVGEALTDLARSDAEGMGGAPRSSPAMPGVGAAETSVEAQRRERAGSLDVPVRLTKGQASRDFEQQRFERETAKAGAVGKPLRERFAEQNEQILANFDSWLDQTGASAPDLRATGKTVDSALVSKAKRAKGEYDAAYTKARAAGEMSELIPTDEIVSFVESHRPEAINAPVLKSIEEKLVQLGAAEKGPDGKLVAKNMSINDLEEVRKMIGSLSEPGTPNAHFGVEAKKLIDAATDGRGGELYKRARRLRTEYAKEFENRGVVAKLLRTKPGTSDRSVAFEDVFSHSILEGSLDDVTALARTLKTAGPEGRAAWAELQGATINHIREQVTKSVALDVKGNRIVSAAQLDKLVRDLDRDGKLDYIFGKQNAEKIRDINDLAKDVHTSPPGAVGTSNTPAVLMQALGEIASGHLSIGTAKAIGVAKKAFDNRKLKKRVRESLADEPISSLTDEEKRMRVGDLMSEGAP